MVNLYLSVHVEESLVVVHPDLCHARRVDAVRVLGDEVGVPRPEDVAHVRARHVLHAAAATPRAERELCRYIDSVIQWKPLIRRTLLTCKVSFHL